MASDNKSLLLLLPNELLLNIIDLIRPDGFEQFCLSCTALYSIANSAGIIKHHNKLKKEYTFLCSPDDFDLDPNHAKCRAHESKRIFHPVTLINDISKTPLVAKYIKHISLGRLLQLYGRRQRDNDEALSRYEAEKAEFQQSGRLMKLLSASPYLRRAGQDAEKWVDTITGKETFSYNTPIELSTAGAFVFLLSLLPNVTSLQVPTNWEDMTESGTYSELGDVMKLLYTITESAGKSPFDSLAKVSIFEGSVSEDDDTGGYIAYKLYSLAPFFLLPNLRCFEGIPLAASSKGEEGYDFQWPYPTDQRLISPLESLHTWQGSVSPEIMGRLLAPMHHLRHIHWVSNGRYFVRTEDVEVNWDVGAFVAAIMDSPARHTLETLRIHHNFESPGLIRSLKGFSKLSRISIQPSFIFESRWLEGYPMSVQWPTGDFVPLVDLLPPTIEQVDIHSHTSVSNADNLPPVILEGLSNNPESLPRLQVINLHKRYISELRNDQNLGFPWWVRGRGSLKYSAPGYSVWPYINEALIKRMVNARRERFDSNHENNGSS